MLPIPALAPPVCGLVNLVSVSRFVWKLTFTLCAPLTSKPSLEPPLAPLTLGHVALPPPDTHLDDVEDTTHSHQLRRAERRHPSGRERMGSPTLQTLQAPILRPPRVCVRGEPRAEGKRLTSGMRKTPNAATSLANSATSTTPSIATVELWLR